MSRWRTAASRKRKIPIIFRLLLPFAPNLDHLATRPAFAKSRCHSDRKLVAAGFEGLLSGKEFLALKLLMPVICGAFWLALAPSRFSVKSAV
jgi:hypothetical protein